jgi:hypothetical protein
LTKSIKRLKNFKQITSLAERREEKIETVAKAIILCLLAISGAVGAITYFYDPGFFKYALESKPAATSQNDRIETVTPSKLSRYKKHLIEESRVEKQRPENTNSSPEQLWTDTYHKHSNTHSDESPLAP